MVQCSIERKLRKYNKGYVFLPFGRIISKKYGKNFLNIATKTRLNAAKTASKK